MLKLALIVYLLINVSTAVNISTTVEISNGTKFETEEFNFELGITNCNGTNKNSHIVDLYFVLKTETTPKLLGKLIQNCDNDEVKKLKMKDIYALIHIDKISTIEVVQIVDAILPNDILIKPQIMNYLSNSTPADYYAIYSMTQDYQYCDLKNEYPDIPVPYEDLWKVFDEISVTFLDILQYDSFKKILGDYYSELNNFNASAVFVDSTSAISNYLVYSQWIKHNEYAKLIGITLNNCERYQFNEIHSHGSQIVRLKTTNPNHNYISYGTSDKTLLKNCVYTTKINNTITEERFHKIENEKNYLFGATFNDTLFKAGSPLICGQTLYGIAESHNFFGIVFSTFFNEVFEMSSSGLPYVGMGTIGGCILFLVLTIY